MLSVRVKSGSLNTAVALNISVQPARWQLIADTIKQARKAYHRGTSIFIDDQLTSNIWLLMKRLMAEDKTNTITRNSIDEAIRQTLHKDEQTAVANAEARKQEELLGVLAPKQEKPSFHDFYDTYTQELQDGTRLRHRSTVKVSESTVDNFKSLRSNIRKYEKQEHLLLDWQDINLAFFYKFKTFLTDQNLKPNTIATYLQRFRTMMRSAKLLHYTTNDDFNIDQWYPENEEVDNVYLTTERINQLYDAKLTDEAWITEKIKDYNDDKLREFIKTARHRQWLSDARDIYVVGCLTGQRYSDYIRINEKMYEYINGKKFIHLKQEKTGTEVYIPLNPKVEAILIRDGGKLPFFHRPKLADNIRICGHILGWTESVPITITKGTMSYEQTLPFYSMLKTHTCRRSFATNAYRANVPLSAIMAVTGHSSEDMLRRYLKLSSKERALFAAEELAKMQTS